MSNIIKLIGIDNKKIQFSMNGSTFQVPRKEIEDRFKVYWFAGGLFNQIEKCLSESTDLNWLNKYKT